MSEGALAVGRMLLGGDQKPQSFALRKAVHCAYYAAFGEICEQWAATFAVDVRSIACRMLNHGNVKRACEDVARKRRLIGEVDCPRELHRFALHLPELQERRHEADYDSSAEFTKGEAVSLLDQADQAVSWLRTARQACRPELHLFLLQCAGARR